MKAIFITFALLLSFASTGLVFAQSGTGNCPPGSTASNCPPPTTAEAKIKNPFGDANTSLTGLFTRLIEEVLFPIGGVLAVLAFIWAGFMFVTAGGDEKKIGTAKTALLYAAIGTAVLLGAVAITKVLTSTLDALK